MTSVYNILEVANCHGGELSYVLALLEEFQTFQGSFGIKFQPLAADKLAMPDYPYYRIYQQLEFSEPQWTQIIQKALATKDVWLDLYDDYSVHILRQHLGSIKGIKLQASTLDNLRLRNQLNELDVSKLCLILNISGFGLTKIRQYLHDFAMCKFQEVILQAGFQRYPTQIADSGLNKLSTLRENFSVPLSFADHSPSDDLGAVYLPVLAIEKGCTYIEKHIMHSTLPTQYDHFSAFSANQYGTLLEQQELYTRCMTSAFVNPREANYLSDTIQLPVLNNPLNSGQIPSLTDDFVYKRTAQKGLRVDQIKEKLADRHILAVGKSDNALLQDQDLRPARVGTLVACRMKSTRLPNKAILSLGTLSTIETCLRNCLKFKGVSHTVLATSTHPEDECLGDYTYSPQVMFRRGDPDDVIARYLDIAEELCLDVIVRVTGDMPYVSWEIFETLIASHFIKGADYSAAMNAAVGTGMEIYNVETLLRIKQHLPSTEMSEYMTYYVTNNRNHFKVNDVTLPSTLSRPYRLTLDYPEDLEVMRAIDTHLGQQDSDFSLSHIFHFLDAHPEIAQVNATKTLRYRSDPQLIERLNACTRFC